MGKRGLPSEVMLFCSVLYNDAELVGEAISELQQVFGDPAYESMPIPFNFTNYYNEEMGSPLHRVLMAFDTLIPRNALPDIKIKTNTIEDRFTHQGKRSVNLDPGLLSLENICLATTKPYSHRVYLDKGIWAEVTLMYKKDSYHALPWTYPDYASQELIGIFNELRILYKERSRCREA